MTKYEDVHDVRKELGEKIERKVSQTEYHWAFGALVAILMTVIGGMITCYISQTNRMTDKIDNLDQRVTVVETKVL